jgi:N12 class adenine-specific DNA methylase
MDDDWLTDLQFKELSRCVTLLERSLLQERKAVIDRCRQALAAIRKDVQETDYGIDISEEEHQIAIEIEQVAQEIPRLLMKNMIVGTWSLFEGYMTGLVRSRIIAEGDLSDTSFATAGKVREMKHVTKYWAQKGIDLPAGWTFVDSIREVRNQIVHDGGSRSDVDDVTDPIELGRHRRTIMIDKFIATREADGKSGIWYHHGSLVVTADFCREVIEFLLEYVKETKGRTYVPFEDEALKRRMRASKTDPWPSL